jgi:hypothetical protein
MLSHRQSSSRTYASWQAMKTRCTNPNNCHFERYMRKGITYDPHWEKFENFLTDMGERPEGMTLDRFPDKNGNYCKNNCRWATPTEQSNNRNKAKNPPNKTSPIPGVSKLKNRNTWMAYTQKSRGKRLILYTGPSFEMAIEARQFYNEFILGEQ